VTSDAHLDIMPLIKKMEMAKKEPVEMITLLNEQQSNDECKASIVPYLSPEKALAEPSFATAIVHHHPTTQWLLSTKLRTHIPEAGLNPLADAAAYLFSMMGRLIHLKSHAHLDKLYAELVREIENFQVTVETYSYNKEYMAEYAPIACYALCATLDDIIASTTWGGQGKWEKFSLVNTFIPEPPSQVSFFIILERLIRDPDIYIDVIEFMYLCLNFGFKCRNNVGLSEFDHGQLEQITHSLYKRIRAYRGNFSKVLSPLPIKPQRTPSVSLFKSMPKWLIAVCVSSLGIIMWTVSACLFKT
jgi:type VI secretion system protein ImpK